LVRSREDVAVGAASDVWFLARVEEKAIQKAETRGGNLMGLKKFDRGIGWDELQGRGQGGTWGVPAVVDQNPTIQSEEAAEGPEQRKRMRGETKI